MKKITVGLITYNRPKLLKRAILSLQDQSFKNFEVLIGNDYEKSEITLKSLGLKKDQRIKIFNFKKNKGERNNMNFLLNKSKSEWFIWLADDDYFHKDLFKRLIKPLMSHKHSKKIIASYSNYSRLKLKKIVYKTEHRLFDKDLFLEGFIGKKIRLIGVFGLMRTKILKKIGGIHITGKSFTNNNKITHHYPYCDILLPILLSNNGLISWIDERLVFLNTDLNSVSSYSKEYDVYKSAEKYLFKNLKKKISNLKNQNKSRIQNELLKLFIFTRFNVIQKNNFFWNLINIPKYFVDLIVFEIRYLKKISIVSLLKNTIFLFKSIYRSKLT
tara:strand:- start:659 stop:1645 length:987 start_codon:yes stop_codon:yes gene_type:complete